jgi:glutaminyl-peptide cyclotransferase
VNRRLRRLGRWAAVLAALPFFCLTACGHSSTSENTVQGSAAPQAATFPPAPAPETTGGFDGGRAYKHVEQLVAIGPHPSGSDGIHRAQDYIIGQLKSFGCPVEEQNFTAPSTPIGDVAMKNILVKIPSTNRNMIIFSSHYDTKRLDNFVGANDGGSSTGVLLELARLLCARKNTETIWLAFFDGEEDFNVNWTNRDDTYGSRELAASLALSGDLRRVKAMILVDMVGPTNPIYRRESNSTPWLIELLWSTAARLGYGNVFINELNAIEDDHIPFMQRNVPSADIIDFESTVLEYWHTPRDTLDKIDPRTLAITGHVLIEAVPELEKRFK